MSKPEFDALAAYRATAPDAAGDLPARMRAVMERAQVMQLWRFDDVLARYLAALEIAVMDGLAPPAGPGKAHDEKAHDEKAHRGGHHKKGAP